MALFKPYKITSDKLEDLTIKEGQIIITTDTKKLYVDVSATERIEITADAEVDLSDYVTTSTLTSTIGEEASARQKQDQLLEQAIDDKLGADDIIAGSNVQVNHDDESGHITISATDTKYTAGTGLGMISNGFYILNSGVGLNQLANDSVSEDKLVDGAVDTAKIADGAVTADKLAEGVIPEIPDVTLASLGVTTTAAELNFVDGVTSNIQTQLNGKAASSHTHSTATTSAAGFLPKLGGGTTNYLRADGTWAKPPDTNTNTTYTLTKSGSTITLTGSDGKTTSVTDSNTTYSLSSFGIAATAAELNKLDGCTATVTELNYLDGVTSNIQTQLNGKAASSHTHDGTHTRIYNTSYSFGDNQNAITTSAFLTKLNSLGAFSDKHWVARGSWSYASNQYINDTGCGNIHLAGCTVEVIGTSSTNCTIIIHTPTTSSSGVTNGDFIYVNNGANYSPGWRRLYSTKYKPTAADIGAAAASHSHSYLPLSGGTLTGTVTARTINPAADSTYNIGSSTVRYANIYADTFTGALSGNASTATTATQANYWTTARTLTFTGNVTGSVSVRGNANMSCALTLANDSVTSAKIAANAVTASEIASGAVGLSELSSAVGTVAVQSATPTDSHVKLWIKV